MKDNYPTRQADTFNIIKREEPVTRGNLAQTIAAQYADFYRENGYVILKRIILLDSVKWAKDEADLIFEGVIPTFVNYEPDGSQIRSALSVHHFSEIRNLLTTEIVRLVKEILGSDIYIYQSRINYKSGRQANGWNWHSDFETWHSKDGLPTMRCLSVMIPLDRNTEENGCLKVIPETHNYFISCPKVGDLDPNAEFSEQVEGVPSEEIIQDAINKYGVQSVICEPGDIVLFDCNLIHGSGRNITTGTRTNVFFVLNSTENTLVDPFSGSEHRPKAMAEFDYTPIF